MVVRKENFNYDFSGDIVISGNGTLYVENSTISLVQTLPYQYKIVLQNPSNGNPRLIVKNSSFTSTKAFRIYLYGNSSMDAHGLSSRNLYSYEVHDSASISLNSSNFKLSYLYAYDNSSVSVSGSDGYNIYVYDSADLRFSTSTVSSVYAFDSSNVSFSISNVRVGLFAEDSSAFYTYSSVIAGNFYAKGNSHIEMSNVVMSFGGKFRCYDSADIKILDSKLVTTQTSIEFSAWDSSAMSFSNVNVNNAMFSTYDNSILSFDDATLVSVWLRSENDSNVNVLNSSVRWLLNARGFSHVSVIQSSVNELFAQGSSQVEVSNSSVELLRVYDTSNMSVSDSTVGDLSVAFFSVNCTYNNLGPGELLSRNFTINGDSPSLIVSNTKIEKGWSFKLSGSSNVTFGDSVIEFLDAFDFVSVSVTNSTLNGYFVSDDAEVSVWSYLTIHVVDYFGNPVAQANVTVSCSDATLTWKLTDNEGLAVFKLFDRMVNSTGTYPADNYDVTVSSGEYSSDSSTKLFWSTLSMVALPSPWWYWYAIIAGIAIAVALAGIFGFLVLRKRFSRRRMSQMGTRSPHA
jgi:hypothetical protein